jgi:hypothetical protein
VASFLPLEIIDHEDETLDEAGQRHGIGDEVLGKLKDG